MSPWPTLSLLPTESIQPTSVGEAGGRKGDESIKPTSILEKMVDQFIQDGIDSRPEPTASPYPSLSPYPTLTRYPTASPTPTASPFPTSSPNPSSTIYPTSSPTPTMSPFPTSSPYPSSSPTPTASPFPTSKDEVEGPGAGSKNGNSVGYGHSCIRFQKGPQQIEEKVVFTYMAEARTTSPDFLTEVEIHLLDHAVSEALECSIINSALHIYEIRYPDDEAASDATTCEPTQSGSKACWILQTSMYITTDRSTKTMAKYTVLEDIQKQLNNENLLTDKFPDLSFTKYLGPDPVETSFSKTEDSNNSDSLGLEHGSVLFYAIIAVSLAVASVFFFVALLIYSRRKKSSGRFDGDDESEDGSIEITELLSKSRERLKEHSSHKSPPSHVRQRGYTDTNVDEWLSSSADVHKHSVGSSAKIRGLEGDSSSHTDQDGTKSTASASTKMSSSAASRYYKKSRQMTPGEEQASTRSAASSGSKTSSKSLRAPSSSGQAARSPRRSALEDPIGLAEERKAFQKVSNKSNRSSARGNRPPVDKLGDASIV
jgi:hypothetical protein